MKTIDSISIFSNDRNAKSYISYLYGLFGDKHNLTRKEILQEFTDVRLFDMTRFMNQTYHPFSIKDPIHNDSSFTEHIWGPGWRNMIIRLYLGPNSATNPGWRHVTSLESIVSIDGKTFCQGYTYLLIISYCYKLVLKMIAVWAINFENVDPHSRLWMDGVSDFPQMIFMMLATHHLHVRLQYQW